MAKKKTKNANPKQIVRDLRDNRKQQKTQREQCLNRSPLLMQRLINLMR